MGQAAYAQVLETSDSLGIFEPRTSHQRDEDTRAKKVDGMRRTLGLLPLVVVRESALVATHPVGTRPTKGKSLQSRNSSDSEIRGYGLRYEPLQTRRRTTCCDIEPSLAWIRKYCPTARQRTNGITNHFRHGGPTTILWSARRLHRI